MPHALDPQVLLATILYTVFGVFVFALAFWVIVKMAPFSVRKEIEDDQNVALAVVVGSVILGLALIIAATVGG